MKKRKSLTLYILLLFAVIIAQGQEVQDFTWPNGAKAALCLTYDDGLPSHVNTVAPMLEKYNFNGTFFPTLSAPSLREDLAKWKALTKDGHELGNHMVYHPCQKSEPDMDWVRDYHDLDKYTLEQVYAEIELANSFLQAIDGQSVRTFAYPCSHMYAGGVSYKDGLHQYATAGRASSEAQLSLVQTEAIDLFSVPSWAPNGHGANDLIAYIEQIIEKKTFSTLTFHGVGAEHMIISKEAHEKMLQYLDNHRDEIWVTTFKEATDYLRQKRNIR